MIPVIILFGILTSMAGLVILINPEIIFGILRKHHNKIGLHFLAVAIRAVLGIFLIYQSDVSKYPFAILMIGWLSIVAAAVLALIGRKRFCNLMVWAMEKAKTYGRFGGVIATAIGVFLVHAFL